MQDKTLKRDCVRFNIPIEVVEESGISNQKTLQIRTEKGKIIIEQLMDVENVVCDKRCEDCPVNGQNCPNKRKEKRR